jgi:hypothetical protein
VGLLGTFVTADDVRLAQARLLANAQGTDASVQQCGALDATTRAAWGLFYVSVVDTVTKGPGFWTAGADMDATQALAVSLYAWQQKIGATCQLALPAVDPNAPSPETNAFMQLARYGMIVVTVVGGAYVVGKVVEVLPLGRGRKE